MQKGGLGSKMGLWDLLVCPTPPHHPPPSACAWSCQGRAAVSAAWLLVPGCVAQPRLEMLRTSVPLHSHPSATAWGWRGRDSLSTWEGRVVWTRLSPPPSRCLEVIPAVGKSLLLC